MGWSNPFRRSVVRRSPNPPPPESDVPWALLVAVLVLCFVLVIALPVMGVMYMDMNNALYRAEQETRKMKELRIKVLREMRGEE
jgi:cytochrome b561